jgi:hypothetical protein
MPARVPRRAAQSAYDHAQPCLQGQARKPRQHPTRYALHPLVWTHPREHTQKDAPGGTLCTQRATSPGPGPRPSLPGACKAHTGDTQDAHSRTGVTVRDAGTRPMSVTDAPGFRPQAVDPEAADASVGAVWHNRIPSAGLDLRQTLGPCTVACMDRVNPQQQPKAKPGGIAACYSAFCFDAHACWCHSRNVASAHTSTELTDVGQQNEPRNWPIVVGIV